MKRSYNACPKCGYKLKWIERVRLSPVIKRKFVPCPMCGVTLSWYKVGHRLIWIGTFSCLLLLPAWLIWARTGSLALGMLFVFPFILLIAGLITGRVEAYVGPNEGVEPDAAPNNRPPSQPPASPQVQTPDSQRASSSGGCG